MCALYVGLLTSAELLVENRNQSFQNQGCICKGNAKNEIAWRLKKLQWNRGTVASSQSSYNLSNTWVFEIISSCWWLKPMSFVREIIFSRSVSVSWYCSVNRGNINTAPHFVSYTYSHVFQLCDMNALWCKFKSRGSVLFSRTGCKKLG